jgi:FkbM family methyltransferase
MKEIIIRLVPNSILQAIQDVLSRRKDQLSSPLITQYQGNDASVLQCCIAYNKYGGYCLPLSSVHRPATQKILSGKVWEPKTIEIISKNCGTGDIVHAGTYFGDFLPAISRTCASHAKVWAFEPHPENYRCSVITININGLDNVEISNAGLGSQEGSMSMLIADRIGRALGGGSKLIESDHQSQGQSVRVKVLRIDDVIPSDRNISVIQLDVEGFEQQALAGAIETIRRCKPMLILESLPDEDWLSENLFPIGYKLKEKVHINSVL